MWTSGTAKRRLALAERVSYPLRAGVSGFYTGHLVFDTFFTTGRRNPRNALKIQ